VIVTEVSAMSSEAPSLKRPALWASVTVPLTLDPAGATVLPCTTMGSVSVASSGSPGLLVFELSSCCVRTVNTVPAGMTTGLGGGGGGDGGGSGAGG